MSDTKPRITTTEDAVFVIDNHGNINEISNDNCETPSQLIAWVLYFIPRGWVTKDLIEEFIELQTKRHNMGVVKLLP